MVDFVSVSITVASMLSLKGIVTLSLLDRICWINSLQHDFSLIWTSQMPTISFESNLEMNGRPPFERNLVLFNTKLSLLVLPMLPQPFSTSSTMYFRTTLEISLSSTWMIYLSTLLMKLLMSNTSSLFWIVCVPTTFNLDRKNAPSMFKKPTFWASSSPPKEFL